jgi:hypothetical protein
LRLFEETAGIPPPTLFPLLPLPMGGLTAMAGLTAAEEGSFEQKHVSK